MITATMNNEIKSFEDMALNFANKELAHRREVNDRYPFSPFDDEVLAKTYDLGFLGITLPEDIGGIGQGISTLSVILESLCRIDASLASLIFTHTLAQEIILKAGAGELLREISTANNARDVLIAFSAYSNPQENKNLPVAAKGNNGYSLSGSSNYVVLAPLASKALIPAKIADRENYSFFLVNLKNPQLKISEPIFSLGVHACPAADIVLDGVEAELVGPEGGGATIFEGVANVMHTAAAAMALGVMRSSFEYALAYSNEREQGGWPIFNWSEIKMMLAGMAVQMKVADLAVSQACAAIENKIAGWNIFSKAVALNVQEAACQATTDGIQVLGGYGYMKDYGQEKRFRDAQQIRALLGIALIKKIEIIDQLNIK